MYLRVLAFKEAVGVGFCCFAEKFGCFASLFLFFSFALSRFGSVFDFSSFWVQVKKNNI
jgi:hypothetical protein